MAIFTNNFYGYDNLVVQTDFAICCTENVSLLAPSDPELSVIAEAKFLDVIGTKVLKVFLLAILKSLFETDYFLI